MLLYKGRKGEVLDEIGGILHGSHFYLGHTARGAQESDTNPLTQSIPTNPGGGVLSPKSYVDVPAGPRKSDYLYTNFLPNFPPISIPFSKEKHPIWIKLGAFYNNLPKIHPIYVIWAPSSLMKTPRSLYQISRKGAPKGRHIYVYHVNVRTPRATNMHWFRNLLQFQHIYIVQYA